jgi:hypothetical protein
MLLDEGEQKPFVLRRSAPKKSRAGDYYCIIDLEALPTVGRNVKIYGINASQAKQLSNQFIRKMLAGRRLIRKNGRPVRL